MINLSTYMAPYKVRVGILTVLFSNDLLPSLSDKTACMPRDEIILIVDD